MKGKYKGLTDEEVRLSRDRHGTNELARIKTVGFWGRFFENLSDPIIRILLIALLLEVVFTLGNCNLIEVFGIVLAILIATLVSTVSECGSERAFRRIEEENSSSYVRAVRSGKTVRIPSRDVVLGDIILLSAGERIEADGILFEGSIEVDQSALNGENREVHKKVCKPTSWELSEEGRVFRGSIVASGEAVMRAERIGADSYYGMVARDVQTETRVSPLKLRLTKLASQISKIGYIVAALVGFCYLFRTVIADNSFNTSIILASLADPSFIFPTLIHALTLMITVIVVAVPEGLPMMITVVLSSNMKRMLKDNILIKKLVGIETAGSLNILFTDKTGTLTEGRLSLDRVITEDKIFNSLGRLMDAGAQYEALALSAIYNTSTECSSGELVGGNSTERAIAEFFRDASTERVSVRERTPFTSESKLSSVTLSDGRVLVKGAPEVILSRCSFALRTGGEAVASDLNFVKRQLSEAITRGERVIAVATTDTTGKAYTFVALLVLKDKIREGVREAVKDALDAGISIVMVTGDNPETAVHIAEDCGFFKKSKGHIALSSSELAKMSDDEVKAILPKLRVLARALPQDKTRLVRLSQELELVVGMTGDGVNDAPSLKLADVGFAMGSGTEIAKAAGDVVILDDSFSAVTKTVLYGRTIFKSIRKFITFQLIMNLAACSVTLIGQLIGIENPITIIQMLWVNIIMDTLGGLAFAAEAPLHYYMKEPPKRRDEPILSGAALAHVALNGIFTLALLLVFLMHPFFKGLYSLDDGGLSHLTAFYALFIFAVLFNCFSARS